MLKGAMTVLGLLVSIAAGAPGWENEPAGSQLISDFGFPMKTGEGWTDAYPGSSVTVVNDPTAPASPASVLQMTYPVGHKAGYSAGNIYHSLGLIREVYVGFWWKASAGWQQETNSGVSKIVFLQSNRGTMFAGMRGAGAPYSIFWCMTMGATICNGHTGSGGDACGARNFDPNTGSVPIHPGAWYKIETYIRYSSTNTSKDGVLRYWVNGTLTANYVDVNYPTEDPLLQFSFDPTWGGMNNTKKQTDYFWFDHVRLSKPNGASDPIFITASSLPPVKAGSPYSATLSANGGKPPYSWTISSGDLFPGLSLNKTTGVISGTPMAGGKCNFTVKVLDSNVPAMEATKAFYIINPAAVEQTGKTQMAPVAFAIKYGAGRIIFPAATLTSGRCLLDIFRISGERIYSTEVNAAQNGTYTIPLSLEHGIYLAQLRTGSGNSYARFGVIK